ncbi:MAG TPA: AAA family ATPase, partial [Methanospirillum sp.]|nr:AAA family ATPase [Methanospirillum sp.]
MKILKLKFSNLNSLAGTWEIDFTNPAFTSSGIFVITGPTGSGKTTILDAICLALYGRTPRLDKVTKASNHIMTRHTGECSAEVVFESQKGRFICHWNQRRARNKPDGELQAPQHEISNADTGEILASKIQQVRDIVKEVTGMDYDQFTKSILLAQGEFTTFLSASEDDRAPILEHITGTDIYSKLSKKTHERYTQEKNLLEQQNRELDIISVLSPEEIEHIRQEIEELKRSIAEKDAEITRTSGALRWIETLQTIRREIGDLEIDALRLAEKKAAFEPSREALVAAQKAATFEGLYASLIVQRKTVRMDTEKKDQTTVELEILQKTLPDIEAAVQTALARVEQAEKERDDGIALIHTIRALDDAIKKEEAEAIQWNEELKGLQNLLKTYITNQDQAKKREQEILNDKSKAAYYISQHASDATIRDLYSGIEQKIKLIEEELSTIGKEKQECIRQKEQLQKLKLDLDAYRRKKDEQKDLLLKKEEEQQKFEQTLTTILSGSSLPDLRKSRDELRIRKDQLSQLGDVSTNITEISAKLENLIQKQDDLTHFLQASEYEKEGIESDLRQRQEILNIKRTNAVLAAKVRDLSRERELLRDGEPCPLCGSLQHPYASGIKIQPDEVMRELAEEEKRIQDLNRRLTAISAAIAQKEEEIRRCREDITDCETKRAALQVTWNEGTDTLGINPKTDEKSLITHMNAMASELRSLDTRIHDAEVCEEQIRKQTQVISKARELLITLEQECLEKEYETASMQKIREEQKAKISACETRVDRYLEEIKPVLEDLGYIITRETNTAAVLQSLQNRQKKYQEEEDRIKSCDDQLAIIKTEISEIQGKISEKTDEITRLSVRIREKEGILLTLRNERKHKYGEKDPESEEKRLSDTVTKAREIRDAKQNERNQLVNRIHSLDSLRLDLEKRILTTQCDLEKHLTEFLTRIREAGFADESAYIAARMSPEEFTKLQKRWDELKADQTKIDEHMKRAQQRYEEEVQKNLTTKDAVEIQEELRVFQEQKEYYLAEIGKNQEKLSRHDEMMRHLGEKIAARDRQAREVERWYKLSDLIGSSDGKKFRVFAQGLTFRILLAHANEHLRRMTDRYILVQDRNLPLDMQVIDTWQG